MKQKLFILAQHIIPQHFITWCAGKLASSKTRWFKNWFIKTFAKQYQVNLNEAVHKNAEDYVNFNDFFTRQLKDGARTIQLNDRQLISPVDGCVSEVGQITDGQIFQAKGKLFNLKSLITDVHSSEHFGQGAFATLYLSPKDYHRVHMSYGGQLKKMTYVPGDLFSVNDTSVEHIDNLFARNERIVCEFDTPLGPMISIMVGAMIVGNIKTTWTEGPIKGLAKKQIKTWDYGDRHIELKQGQEMGQFLLGSTAILIMPNKVATQWHIKAGDMIRLGQPIADLNDGTNES